MDAEFFKREMDALFGRMWICAGRIEQVERPGQFFLREVLGESMIVTRGRFGRVHAFYNVCRHRGTKLCTDRTGVSPEASSARITRGPTISKAG